MHTSVADADRDRSLVGPRCSGTSVDAVVGPGGNSTAAGWEVRR